MSVHYQTHDAVKRQRLAYVYYRLLLQDGDFRNRLTACYEKMRSVPETERRAVAQQCALPVRVDDLLYSYGIWEVDPERLYLLPSPVFCDFPDTSVHVSGGFHVRGMVYWDGDRERLLSELENQYRALREELLRQIDAVETRLREHGMMLRHPRYETEEDLTRKAWALFYRLYRRMSYGAIGVKMGMPRSSVQRLVNESRAVLGI